MRKLVLASAALSVAAVLLPATSAQAIEDPYIAARASTLGVGVEGGAKILPFIRLRGIAQTLDIDYDDEIDDIRYNGNFKLGSVGVQADFFPFNEGPVFVSAGLYSNGNKIDASARPTGNAEIGGATYTPDQIGTLTARARYEKTAPYLGVGAEWSLYPAVISLEAGAFFQGAPKVTLTSDGSFASNPAYQSSLEQERQSIEKDLDSTKTWPVVSLAVGIRF
ncbi:hypothetical protein [Asticcacaulis sp. AC402]|uniref:hypothetical protein n=1 Tax=Asticcacaulis sp. AC402 TaxID=1282361 RepID=UPI0003C3E46E|nr:hypothetical protein [Asticcacaulis sp. AC402]ESQ74035.1 hypothetical protein ABAC402_16185 [Asticcacaulis sp. AC402]